MTLDDARDLFAFLKTLAAGPRQGARSRHAVSRSTSAAASACGSCCSSTARRIGPIRRQSAAWNRGAYLVNGPGHCAECHSPRNLAGGIVAAQRFTGGPSPEGKGWVPNITQHGLKDWSEKDIVYLLETGLNPEGDSVGSTMAEVVRNTEQLSPQDRGAIASYIKSLPPIEGEKPPAKK